MLMPYLNNNSSYPPPTPNNTYGHQGQSQGPRPMFSAPFSFEGRIRRLEFGLSLIIGTFAYSFVMTLIGVTANGPSDNVSAVLFLIIGLPVLIAYIWFMYAQGAKRCHDVGWSGWMQLIPAFPLVLLFIEGNAGNNEYGANPKG